MVLFVAKIRLDLSALEQAVSQDIEVSTMQAASRSSALGPEYHNLSIRATNSGYEQPLMVNRSPVQSPSKISGTPFDLI